MGNNYDKSLGTKISSILMWCGNTLLQNDQIQKYFSGFNKIRQDIIKRQELELTMMESRAKGQ